MQEAPSARQRFDSFVEAASAAQMSDSAVIEANEDLVHRYYEMWNRGDGSSAASILGPTYLDHAHPEVIGPAAMRSLVPRFQRTHPGARMTIAIVAADPRFVAVRNTITHALDGRGMAAEGIALFRIDAGKLVEQWSWYPEEEAPPSVKPSSIEHWLAFRA